MYLQLSSRQNVRTSCKSSSCLPRHNIKVKAVNDATDRNGCIKGCKLGISCLLLLERLLQTARGDNVAFCAQEFNPAALARLMDSSAQLRSKHLDMQFMRRRRQKNPLGVSRQWFVNADLWLAGTAAAGAGEGQLDNQPQVN